MEEDEDKKEEEVAEEIEEEEEVVEEEEEKEKDDGSSFFKSSYLYIPIILALVVVFFVLIRARTLRKPAVNIEVSPTPVSEGVFLKDSLFVDDVVIDNSVTVEDVNLNQSGFVVVHEDDDGTPGKVIGASEFLPEGKSRLLQITLNRKAVENEILYVMIHADNGDKEFIFPDSDLPVLDEDGKPAMREIAVSFEE